MFLLGQVIRLAYDGNLIVSGNFSPQIGLGVQDSKNRSIGKVSRVFGPVRSPFITIKTSPNHKPSLDILGKSVYVRENNRIKL